MRWIFFAVICIAVTVITAAYIDRPHEVSLVVTEIEGSGAAADLDFSRIERDIRALSACDSRLSGYAGERAAFDLIQSELAAAGIVDITVQSFPVVVPVDGKGTLLLRDGAKAAEIPVHALWPNLGRTCMTAPQGLRGPLVDVKGGTESELRGRTLSGSIVLMNWDCNLEWLGVPEFGGVAVVFRGDVPGEGAVARRKFLSVPVDIPRYYVAARDVPALEAFLSEGNATEAALTCDSRWQTVSARNILATIGPNETAAESYSADRMPIVFHAYYDAVSVVPDLAPGAEQACGAAALLELARYFAAHRPARPVQVLFTGGHGQALAGMTHYIKTVREGKAAGPGLMVGLDLSSRSDSFGVFCVGHFRGQYEHLIRHKFSTLAARLDEFAGEYGGAHEEQSGPKPFVDGVNLASGRGWWTFFPYRVPFESELPTLAGIPGITLATVNDARRFVDTPDDTIGHMRFDILKRQLASRPGEHAGLLGIARAITQWKGPFVSSPLADKWASILGRAVWLDQRRNYTPNEPLAGATVFMKTGRGDKYLMGTRGIPCAMTDDRGHYAFEGLIQTTDNGQFRNCAMEVYGTADTDFPERNPEAIRQYLRVAERKQDESGSIARDGSIVYAVDMARSGDYPWTAKTDKAEQHVNIVCFPCRSFSLLGLTDPRGYIPLTDIQILDAATRSTPFQFGRSLSDMPEGDEAEALAALWTDPSLRILVTLGVGFQGKRLILINNSPETPEGRGFVTDELTTLPSMLLQGARDMWTLDDVRISKLESNGVNNPRIRRLHEESKSFIDRAGKALKDGEYGRYRLYAEKGWALEGKAYGETLETINNMIHGVLFYLALLLPLSYCLERLLVASETVKKRIIWIGVIFAVSFLLLAAVHPAFRFTLTPLLVLLAFIIIALVVTVSVLIVGKMDAVLQERKAAATGRHEDRYRRGGVAVRALDLGMSNIRRRPQRGFLTGLSVVMVTFILLSFTSLIPVTSISRLKHPRGTPSYRGLLARDRAWIPLPDALHESLRRNFDLRAGGAVVAARSWFFSDQSGQLSRIDLTAAGDGEGGPEKSCTVAALIGMEADEPEVSGVAESLVAGAWFADDAQPAIILSARAAGQLGYGKKDIGAQVRVFGEELPLAGIIKGELFDAVRDLDGEPLTPVNFVLQRERTAQAALGDDAPAKPDTLEEYIHYSVDQVAIVPYRYAQRLGARIRSVAVKTAANDDMESQAEGYARRSNLTILGSNGDRVTLYAALDTSQLSAAWQIVIPMFLGFVMILGTMLGSVYERQGEIFVYNSVGLSPTNVSSLFIAESAVYAIVGAGLGYLLGQASSKVLQATGMLSGLTLNYSAGSTIFVTLLVMLIVFLSAIYPARRAFHAAVPDVEKEQESDLASMQSGDSISFFLPFVAAEEYRFAMQAYLAEYLESIQGVTIGRLAIDNLQAVVEAEDGETVPILRFRAWMAPFDLGVSHDAQISIVRREPQGVYQYHLAAQRFSGDRQNWSRLTPRFVQAIRKQLLMWRVLGAAEYEKYRETGSEIFRC